MRLSLDDIAVRRRRVRRFAVRFAIAVVPVAIWSGMPVAVQAQSGLVPQTNGQGPLRAPIGHRQPRPQDLPPDVLLHEGMSPQLSEPAPTTQPNASRDQSDSAIGRGPFEGGDLGICRQC